MHSTPEQEYDEWYHLTHPNGTSLPESECDPDVDECVEDCFDDIDEY